MDSRKLNRIRVLFHKLHLTQRERGHFSSRKILLVFCFQVFFSIQAFADNPFLTDNPDLLGPNERYAVLYNTYTDYRFGKAIQGPAAELDFNVFRNLEIDTYTPLTTVLDNKAFRNGQGHENLHNKNNATFPNAVGIGDIGIEVKYLFIQESKYMPQVALAPVFYLPTGNYYRGLGNGRFWYYPGLAAQKSFGSWLLYTSGGYVVVNDTPGLNDYFFGGFVAQKQVTKKLALGAELYSQGRSGEFIAPLTLLNIGTQYQLAPKFTLLASIGHSIAGENLTIGYFGVAWG